jgi:hypothetical protein
MFCCHISVSRLVVGFRLGTRSERRRRRRKRRRRKATVYTDAALYPHGVV